MEDGETGMPGQEKNGQHAGMVITKAAQLPEKDELARGGRECGGGGAFLGLAEGMFSWQIGGCGRTVEKRWRGGCHLMSAKRSSRVTCDWTMEEWAFGRTPSGVTRVRWRVRRGAATARKVSSLARKWSAVTLSMA